MNVEGQSSGLQKKTDGRGTRNISLALLHPEFVSRVCFRRLTSVGGMNHMCTYVYRYECHEAVYWSY